MNLRLTYLAVLHNGVALLPGLRPPAGKTDRC